MYQTEKEEGEKMVKERCRQQEVGFVLIQFYSILGVKDISVILRFLQRAAVVLVHWLYYGFLKFGFLYLRASNSYLCMVWA
jgi:hypothetical protein